MLYLNIETSQERSRHTVMIIDQHRLILMIKTSHASWRNSHSTKNRKRL